MIGAGSGLAPFRGFWQHLIIDSECRETIGVVDRVSFYEAVQLKTKEMQTAVGLESPFLQRRARLTFLFRFLDC